MLSLTIFSCKGTKLFTSTFKDKCGYILKFLLGL